MSTRPDLSPGCTATTVALIAGLAFLVGLAVGVIVGVRL